MDNIIMAGCDMQEPRFSQEGYDYIGEDEKWHIRDDAPDWAKKEFEEYYAKLHPEPDGDGFVIQY